MHHSRFRFASLVSLLFVAVTLSGCSDASEAQEDAQYHPEVEVSRISTGLNRTFVVTGQVEPIKRSDFTAEFKATVEQVDVKPGDAVEQGRLLIKLTAPDVTQRYSNAAATYGTANLNLEQTKVNAQKSVEAAEVALATAENNLTNVLAQSKSRRVQAQEALNAAAMTVDLSVSAAETEIDNTVSAVPTTVESSLNAMSVLLEGSSTYADLDYVRENHIGVRDPVLLSTVKVELAQNVAAAASVPVNYDQSLALLRQTEATLTRVLTVLRNSVTSSQYTQAQLDGDVARINGELASIRSLVSRFQSARKALDTAKQQTGKTSQAVVSAQAAYDATIADIDANETTARRRLEEAKAALQTAKTSAGIAELGARTSLTSVAGELMQSKIEQGKLVLRAPFKGTVADVAVKPGTVVESGDPVVSVEDASSLKIVAYLSASEVRRVAAGDAVAIREGAASGAVITAVAPSADSASKKYKVEILLENSPLKPGEFVEVSFSARQTDLEAQGRIFVPVTAVQLSSNETFVWTVADDSAALTTVVKTPVTLGSIEGDSVEIRSGIADGDLVIVKGGRILEDEGQEVTLSADIE